MSNSVIFLVLVMCQPFGLFAQAANSVALPKPAVDPAAGTWKYKITDVQADGTYVGAYSITIKDDGRVWTVTTAWETPYGPVTDVSTLEKGTLILCKESFRHFAKPGQPWKPVAIDLDFRDSKVTGTNTNGGGEARPVAIDLRGPLFADAAGTAATIGCMPLADGYSATFRKWDIQKLEERLLQLKVVGTDHVTVPAGTFDSYKVEFTTADGLDKGTVWIAKDSRTPVKGSSSRVVGNRGLTILTTTELAQ